MKETTRLVTGLLLVLTGIFGVMATGCCRCWRTDKTTMMNGGMMQGRGMMGGMMGDMMRNMEEIERKTEFSSRGEQLFFTGTDLKGEHIKNSHGMQGVGCAMCHGADANGMKMMMMDVPPLRWQSLVDPKGHIHPSGRRHPPFTEPSFKTCVIAGTDPAGNSLSVYSKKIPLKMGN